MSGETGASALFLLLILVLPVASLVARRVPLGQVAKMALGWIVIFAVAILLVSQRDRFAGAWSRVTAMFANDNQRVVGDTVRIAKSDDGHFWATAQINGVRRRMLIDSGATITALSERTARAAHIDTDQSPFATVIDTANGQVAARRATIGALAVGSILTSDLPVIVSPAFGDTDVLGMNFLSRLKGWRVEGDTLILVPAQPEGNLT